MLESHVMQTYAIRGGTLEDLEAKHYTIGVGISLGNKWFNSENMVELTKWALSYSKDKVIIYVADSIHAINLEVRNNISYDAALRKAKKKGSEILKEVRNSVERDFKEGERNRIVYAAWSDLVDQKYKEKVAYLYRAYEENTDFALAIQNIVTGFTAKEDKQFSKIEINRLCHYILEELPECISRVSINGIICDAYAYPHDGALPIFVERIQKGELFPEIRAVVMDTEPKVFMEVR